jgi:hypothetical protein
MDLDQLLSFLKPEVISAMILAPILFQLLKAKFGAFGAKHAAVLNFLVCAGVVLHSLMAEWIPFNWNNVPILLTQITLAWLLSDIWYRGAVAPIAENGNPMLPKVNQWVTPKGGSSE